jgi:hypothetical protein
MNRSAFVVGLAATAAIAVTGEGNAHACGGCFHPPTQVATDITDERMLLSVSPAQTTLFDQIQYAGSPSSFAWVLPIHGTVTVGLSADVLFDSIDVLTATQITQPPSSCPQPQCASAQVGFSGSASGTANAGAAEPAVTVLKQANVGPYETVQLHATDSSALDDWLAQNGFVIPADVTPVIAEYVTEGFDFLAMKLLPGAGVKAMRPVRVTMPGASLSLPLRMAAVGTGSIVGITIWVVADGRYEPQNFPFFHIDDSALVWDWSASLSNYTTLRVQNEADLKNAGWEIESSLTLSQQLITSVILSGGQYYGGLGGGGGFGGAAPSDPSVDYLPIVDPDGDAGDADTGVAETAEEVRTDDLNALFAGVTLPNARVTRIRSDISHAAMTVDLALQASADQSELSNIRNVTKSVNEVCPVYNGCTVVGSGPAPSSGSSGSGASGGAGDSSGAGGSSTAGGFSGTVNGAGSGSASGTLAATGGSRGGCMASPQSTAGTSAGLGGLAGLLGLAIARAIRARRRSRP